MRGIADLFHKRYGEGAGAVDICDRGAGDRAKEAGAHDGDVGRAAGSRAGKGLRHLHKIGAGAAFFKEAAKDEEGGDQSRGDAERHGEYSLIGEIDLFDHFGHGE
ncbi:hypothetical protein SDC9_210309 [bioreactor metagenome]|uniref:Uncharacterized protein n=1 Tax=bioreactor metagenome TaxID=1076179 RepID=A0A645JHI3_9ZZZZ